MTKIHKMMPKWRNFAKSGHTSQVDPLAIQHLPRPLRKCLKNQSRLTNEGRAVFMAQLAERLLPTTEAHGSNPVIGKTFILTICFQSTLF